MLFVWLQKRVRLQKELTFQDLYENQELFDEEDDDEDGDWDPSQLQMCVEVIKWFCKNCTVDNINNDVCCRVCL
jgi:histone deacetylase 6